MGNREHGTGYDKGPVWAEQVITEDNFIGFLSGLDPLTVQAALEELDGIELLWTRVGTVLSPVNAGDDLAIAGDYHVGTVGLSDTASGASGCSLVGIPSIGTPTWTTVCNALNLINSTGRATGGNVTDAGSENLAVALGTGFIKATDDDTAELLSFDWVANNSLATTTDTHQYVGITYDGINPPLIDIRAAENYDLDTEFALASVVNEGGVLHILNNPWWVTDGITNIIERFRADGYIIRDNNIGGLVLTVPGTRNIAVSAGTLWSNLNEFPIPAINTSVTGTVEYYWYDAVAGEWKDTDETQYSVLLWNDFIDANPILLANNKYANIWVYAEADDTEISIVYPQNEYVSAAGAESEAPPSDLPLHIKEHGILIGRIIIKQAVDAPVQVDSAWEQTFSASQASDHGNLAGLSGDDHVQYLLADGTRALAGAWDMASQILTNVNIDTGDINVAVTNTEWDAAYSHISADGSSHTFIDQSVISGASPTFTTVTGDISGNAGTVSTITGLAPDTATTQATQPNITSAANLATVGTIGTGVWEATAIDGAYVDIEGTEVKSTGEGGGSLFLRENGDGTCSWQAAGGGGCSFGTTTQVPYMNGTDDDFIYSSNLAFNGTKLTVTGDLLVSSFIKYLDADTTGTSNLFIGEGAGAAMNGGDYNLLIGKNAGSKLATQGRNIAIGYNAMSGTTNKNPWYNVIIGYEAGKVLGDGGYNTAIGVYAGKVMTSAQYNVLIGYNSGLDLVNGRYNLCVGSNSGYHLTAGYYNINFGTNTGQNNKTGSYNVFIGHSSGYGTQATTYLALYNVGVGASTLYNVSHGGHGNTAIGYQAGNSITTGTYNVCIGYDIDVAVVTSSYQLNIANVIQGNYTTGSEWLGLLYDKPFYFGTGSDASIGFDGNSLNIIANAVTGTDTLNLTAGVIDASAGGGIIFPTSDPSIAGAWWDNAGTLTKSSG